RSIRGALDGDVEVLGGEVPYERCGLGELVDRYGRTALVVEQGHRAVEARRPSQAGLAWPAGTAPDRDGRRVPPCPQLAQLVEAPVQRAPSGAKIRVEPELGVLAVHRSDGGQYGQPPPRQGVDRRGVPGDVLDLPSRQCHGEDDPESGGGRGDRG